MIFPVLRYKGNGSFCGFTHLYSVVYIILFYIASKLLPFFNTELPPSNLIFMRSVIRSILFKPQNCKSEKRWLMSREEEIECLKVTSFKLPSKCRWKQIDLIDASLRNWVSYRLVIRSIWIIEWLKVRWPKTGRPMVIHVFNSKCHHFSLMITRPIPATW